MCIDEILDRLKEHLQIKSESKLARALGVRPQNVKNWRDRGTIPWEELYIYTVNNPDVKLDWLFNGIKNDTGGKSITSYKSESPPDIGTLINLIKQTVDKKDTDSDILLSSMDALLKKHSDPSRAAGGSNAVPKKTALK